MRKIVTIGAIGWNADTFFQALREAGVDTFVDVRRRRAVRGRDYAFANSKRLQERLAEEGIRYLHRADLASPQNASKRQAEADEAAGIARRKRTELSPVFVDIYEREVLGHFEPSSLTDELPDDAAVVALMCVEREPAACHRSLLADYLGKALDVGVEHLTP